MRIIDIVFISLVVLGFIGLGYGGFFVLFAYLFFTIFDSMEYEDDQVLITTKYIKRFFTYKLW